MQNRFDVIDLTSATKQSRVAELLATSFAGTPLAYIPEDDDNYADGIQIVPAPKPFKVDNVEAIVHKDRYDDANNAISDGCDCLSRYELDGGVWAVIGRGNNDAICLVDGNSTWEDFFRGWDFGDTPTAEGIAAFGLDATPDEADDDATDVRVWVAYNYYGGTLGAPTDSYARSDDDNEPLVFDTTADAQEWIDDKDSGTYYLAHGEAGRPEYTIVE